jgi:hypothetical protein
MVRVGDARTPPIPSKVVVYAPAKRADTLPLFLLNPFLLVGADHRVHRVVTAAFWRTFHHEGKISLAGKGGGCTPTPFLYYYHHQ